MLDIVLLSLFGVLAVVVADFQPIVADNKTLANELWGNSTASGVGGSKMKASPTSPYDRFEGLQRN